MFMINTYQGKHRLRRPASHRTRFVAATLAALGFGLLYPEVASAAPTTDLNGIAACESGGNPQASNGTHFGLFQFDLQTWHSVGGTGDPRNASVAEQYSRAGTLMAQRGTQPWAASQGCWGGGAAPRLTLKLPTVAAPHPATPLRVAAPRPVPHTPAQHPVPIPVPAPVAHSVAPSTVHLNPASGTHTVVPGETLSGITGGDWQPLYAKNVQVIGGDPNLILPGEVLTM